MKLIFIAILVMLSLSAFAGTSRDTVPAATPSVQAYSTAGAVQPTSMDSTSIAGITAVGTAACDAILLHNGVAFGNSAVICGVTAILLNALRKEPDIPAAALGVGVGTLVTYSWAF